MGFIPRYNIDSFILSRMLRSYTCEENLCRKEGILFVDVGDHFNKNRSLYSRDGLHLNRAGKATFSSVPDEGVRKESYYSVNF